MQVCGATSGVLTFANFIGALYAAFQYEKRFKMQTGNAILAITGVLCLTDLYHFIIYFSRNVTQDRVPFPHCFLMPQGS
jgi:hypothetical protein